LVHSIGLNQVGEGALSQRAAAVDSGVLGQRAPAFDGLDFQIKKTGELMLSGL
jgi:hypothetical protein